jgi:long-subunit acyl-CoA synthetase (AMP-forming)
VTPYSSSSPVHQEFKGTATAPIDVTAIDKYGIKKGDKVAFSMRNYPEWINIFIAITSIGAIAVPLNSWWTKDELKYGIENCGAKIIIVDDKRYDLIETFADTDNLSLISIRCNTSDDLNWDNFNIRHFQF